MTFDQFDLERDIIDSTAKISYTEAFPIQKLVIPRILDKEDTICIAPTGSGKTAAFALPILSQILNLRKNESRAIDVLVLVPTRELAVQVGDVFNNIIREIPQNIRCISIYGGVSINPQMKSLFGTNILVATPGRLLELVEKNALSLFNVQTLVLDEADKLLNQGFKDEIESVLNLLPKRKQNLFFSATFSKKVEQFAMSILNNPIKIKFEDPEENIDNIEQVGYFTTLEQKGVLLRQIINEYEGQSILVFASSIRKVDNLVSKLTKNNIDAVAIHSKVAQTNRASILKQFKSGDINVLVTTDLLARGIDIDKLGLVINYELPRSPKDYVHRIGRTGRANNKGKAITLICPEDKHHFKIIQKKMGKRVDMIDGVKILQK